MTVAFRRYVYIFMLTYLLAIAVCCDYWTRLPLPAAVSTCAVHDSRIASALCDFFD